MLQYLLVGSIAQGNGIQVVLLHELVEEVCAQHHRLRYRYLCILMLVHFRVALDDIVEKSQSTPLSAKRALSYAGKVGVAVELQPVEYGHYAYVLHPAVLHYGVEDNLAVGVNVLQLVPRDVLQECRYREDGPRGQPSAHVVSRHVVAQRVGGNLEDVVLQLLEARHAGYLLMCLRVAEHEVAEAHVLLHQAVQVYVHLCRVLVYEVESLFYGLLPVHSFAGVENQRHVLVASPYLSQQLQSSLGVSLVHVAQPASNRLHREAGV